MTSTEIIQESDWQRPQLSFLDYILHNSSLTLTKAQAETYVPNHFKKQTNKKTTDYRCSKPR